MTDSTSNINTNTPRQHGRSESYWRAIWHRLRGNRRGMVGLCFIVLMCAVWLGGPLLATGQPIACKYKGRWYFPAIVEIFQSRRTGPHWVEKSRPFNLPQFNAKSELSAEEFAIWPLIPYHEYEQTGDFFAPPSVEHIFGTDELGRDIAARMIHGTAVSVKVGFISMGIAAVIGIFVGAMAGYWGGLTDMLVSRVVEIVICFPVFFLILAIMAWLEPNITNVMIVIGLTRWTGIARYTRGEFIRIKTLDYVTAARSMGIGHFRMMFRHILPNALAPVLVSITFGIAGAVLVEAGLSWLGFGVQAPNPSWGNILRTAYDSLRVAPHMVYPPCIAIFLAVLAYNLLGDAMRDAIDPRLKGAT